MASAPGRAAALLASAFLLAGGFVGLSIGLATLAGVPVVGDGFGNPIYEAGAAFGVIAVPLGAVALTVRGAAKRPFGSVSSIAGWNTYFAAIAIALVIIPLQAAAEEYFARGWLLQMLRDWTHSRSVAVALSSTVFVALHGTLDPWAVIDLTIFALALCWLTLRTGGLEAALVLHAVVNGVYWLAETSQGIPDLDAVDRLTAWNALPRIAVTVLYTLWIARRSKHLAYPLPTRSILQRRSSQDCATAVTAG